MGLYGGPSRTFTLEEFPGTTFYEQVNSETGVTEIYKQNKILGIGVGDGLMGTITPPNKFTPGKDYKKETDAAGRKKFQSDAVQKKLRAQAVKTAKDGCIAVNPGNKEACGARAEELIETGKATTEQDATDIEVSNENLSKLTELFEKVEDIEGTNEGISGKTVPLRYPTDIAKNQDVIKFSLIKYKVKDITTSGPKLGTGDRVRISPNAEVGSGGNREIIATVILPVPGQIQDTNSATWSDDSANAGQLAAAGLGANAATGGDIGKTLTDMADKVIGGSKQIQAALTSTLVGNATGTNLLGRAGGVILNPNLELLFSKPSLREFSLTFRLSARSKEEGLEIIKIIRFFKQGMAPIREASNLFLKAPNTFQVHYLLRGKESGEHPFIGRMKECALTSVNTNYTPENNYATYENGLMISYQISLTLKELEPVYNDNYKDIPATEIGF